MGAKLLLPWWHDALLCHFPKAFQGNLSIFLGFLAPFNGYALNMAVAINFLYFSSKAAASLSAFWHF